MKRAAPTPAGQVDLFEWARECELVGKRVTETNAERACRRGYLVFATDPSRHPDEPGYRNVYATEARTPAEAAARVKTLAPGRRLRAYLATGSYSEELANAQWVSPPPPA
jgi:hypothetical protein